MADREQSRAHTHTYFWLMHMISRGLNATASGSSLLRCVLSVVLISAPLNATFRRPHPHQAAILRLKVSSTHDIYQYIQYE